MKIDWRYELPQLAVLAAMFVAAAVCWPLVPERLPVHWNLAGEVDRYGGKFEGLLVVPLISLGLYGLFLVLPMIDPGRANYAGFWRTYTVIRCLCLGFMAAIFAATLTASLGVPLSMGRVISSALGVLFLVLGNYMGKIRPNWFVGVRTPWTLSSKVAWTKTHRLAGWLFMLAGAMFVLQACWNARWLVIVQIIYGAIALVSLVVYSYWLWRSDPDRTPPAGTSPSAN